jgi:Skp family chaperone for outer membrane proteins
MRNLAFLALGAIALAAPAAVQAQARGGIIIVDTDNIMANCTACRAASTQLQQRQATIRTRVQTLQQQLQSEGKPIEDAAKALNGKQPDAALKARVQAFETKRQNAEREIQNSQAQLQSTAANVQQQIGARLVQVIEQVRARRGAAIAIAKDSTLANDTAGDVTTEVLNALNTALPSVSVTPLPQQQQAPQQSR